MKKLILLCLFISAFFYSSSQPYIGSQYKNLDVLGKELAAAKTTEQKTFALIALYLYHSRHIETFNKKAAIDYQQKLEIYTHEKNDPYLIARVLHITLPTTKDGLKKGIDRLYNFAKLHNLDFYKARAKLREVEYNFTYQPDKDKVVPIINEALNLTKNLNDTLKCAIFIEAGFGFNTINNHLQALQLAFQAYEIASKNKSTELLRNGNGLFASIYFSLKDYNKATAYTLKDLQYIRKLGRPHILAARHAIVARNYFMSDQPVLGNYHVQEAYRLADSIKGSKRLYNEITGIVISALSISDHNSVLAEFLNKYRQHFFTFPGSEFLDNVTLARAYMKIGNTDSARSLIKNAGIYFSENTPADQRKRYYYTLARIAIQDNNWDAATENFRKCFEITLLQSDLRESMAYADSLKILLLKQNNLPGVISYYNLKDSLQSEWSMQLDKEDITRQEIVALEKEKEMQAIEKEKEKNQRHNLQYLGITFSVVALFILLLLMGIFKVSQRTIKILSFFSFLLFFEFIFLIFKKQIAVITHGEPWKDLVFMVLLAAVMVPLHHWGEKKVVKYLSTKKISFFKTKSLRRTTADKQLVS